ncbi:MAG TPA: DNA mismatch repair endonuclease MutL [Deltaproteobacteria bacterium]|nr:DNA mismatch repair endonuclease MutL [Deltaproteobacteria bacterium]HOI06503.1 DNA mismatch repair endonuclease MutL [Deltaproteobacteria bacterium]
MGLIRVLDQELINQIAAGEVIERPASVVKELLENALDAGATNIAVEIEGSGLDLIRLADDGYGMTAEELELAILRHATSKISSTEDLFSIKTLGFRGEALPSILSVSRAKIATRTESSPAGCFLHLVAGETVERGRKGMPRGTVVEVSDLFFNTPARRKFLKSAPTEVRHIVDVVSRYSLAYPAVRFTLSLSGRTLLNLRQGGPLEERVVEVWGSSARDQLFPLLEERGNVRIRGILASPGLTRQNRSGIYTYVNGRSVLDSSLRAAVLEGYSGLVMKGRCPMAVLFIDIDASEVDVNVHPAKAEVRFRNPSAVFGAVAGSIRRALSGPREPAAVPEAPVEPVLTVQEAQAPYSGRPFSPPLPRKTSLAAAMQPGLIQEGLFRERPGISYGEKRIVGTFLSTYILLEDESALYILDQHAAHERVTYERLKAAPSSGLTPGQDLLAPLVIELSAVRFSAFEEIAPEIRSIGIDASVFGQGAVAVRSVPAPLVKADIRGIILDLLDAAAEGDLRKKELHDDMLARIACHRSVRAGRRLEGAEIERLLKDLDEAGSPLTCPHGRPLFKKIGRDEIERWIGRRP